LEDEPVLRNLGLSRGISGKSVVVQGLGNVGYHAARAFEQAGARLIALAEIEGAIFNPDGLPLEAVLAHRKETGSIQGFPGAMNLTTAAALELECDVLIPAALQHQIVVANAGRIRAKIVAEAANAPVTTAADVLLQQRGVVVVPDVFLNAGGVTVSYFEWLKNLEHVSFERLITRWERTVGERFAEALERLTGKTLDVTARSNLAHGPTEQELVHSALENTQCIAYRAVRDLQRERELPDLRTAAWVLAIDRVAEVYDRSGIFP
jgi:glutamate dehydrogenase (NAD(P)+)